MPSPRSRSRSGCAPSARLIDEDETLTADDRWRLFCIALAPQAFLHREADEGDTSCEEAA